MQNWYKSVATCLLNQDKWEEKHWNYFKSLKGEHYFVIHRWQASHLFFTNQFFKMYFIPVNSGHRPADSIGIKWFC